MIYINRRRTQTPLGLVPYQCPGRCNALTAHVLIEVEREVKLYWVVPLARWDRYAVICHDCGYRSKIDKAPAGYLLAVGAQIARDIEAEEAIAALEAP